jgi:hypothetical protein
MLAINHDGRIMFASLVATIGGTSLRRGPWQLGQGKSLQLSLFVEK